MFGGGGFFSGHGVVMYVGLCWLLDVWYGSCCL